MLSNYQQYKALKRNFNIEYRGFNLGQIMATDLLYFVYHKRRNSLKQNLHRIRSYYNINEKIGIDRNALFTYSIERPDYLELIHCYIQNLGLKDSSDVINLSDGSGVRTRRMKFSELFFHRKNALFNFVSSLFHVLFISKQFSFTLVAWMVIYKNTIDRLYKYDGKIPSQYYAFNSAYGFETLLTLFLQKHKVPTYCLQHGIYAIYEEPIPEDFINYENFVGDKMLCWGEYSKSELIRYGIAEQRLEVFGNPKYSNVIAFKKRAEKFETALVILARKQYDDGNLFLLKMLSSIDDISFEIKLHPSLEKEKYYENVAKIGNIKIIEEDVLLTTLFQNAYDFVITYNTSAHYEALISGKLCFGSSYMSDGNLLFRSFNNKEELKNLIKDYETKPEDQTDSEIIVFLQYTMGV